MADSSPLLLSSLVSASVDIVQNSKIIKSYIYPSAELRQGLNTTQLELEIKEAISLLLVPGLCKLTWRLKRPNSAFQVDTFQSDVINEENLIVIAR